MSKRSSRRTKRRKKRERKERGLVIAKYSDPSTD
jgi:hypothetical protein